MNFRGTRPLPSKIASDFRRQRSVSSEPYMARRKTRVFFLCPCGAEGKTSYLSFLFLAPFSKVSSHSKGMRGNKREKGRIFSSSWKRKIEDRSENRMRFSERSRIYLIARRAKEQIQDFSFPGRGKSIEIGATAVPSDSLGI